MASSIPSLCQFLILVQIDSKACLRPYRYRRHAPSRDGYAGWPYSAAVPMGENEKLYWSPSDAANFQNSGGLWGDGPSGQPNQWVEAATLCRCVGNVAPSLYVTTVCTQGKLAGHNSGWTHGVAVCFSLSKCQDFFFSSLMEFVRSPFLSRPLSAITLT